MKLASLVVLLLVSLSCCFGTVSAQPNVTFTTYSAMVAQLRVPLFIPSVRDQIIDSMLKTMKMYTFLDLNLNSSNGAPEGASVWAQSFDVIARINALKNVNFQSAYDMEEAFNQVFVPLNDAHTSYHKTYTAYAFSLPIKMQSRTGTDGKLGLFLWKTGAGEMIYKSVYGYSPLQNATLSGTNQPVVLTAVEGFEIVQINHQPAIEYLWNLASLNSSFQVGISKDQQSRFNLLTHGFGADSQGPPGDFIYRAQRSYGIPESSTVIFTVVDPTDAKQTQYDIPYQFLGMGPPAGMKEFPEEHFPRPKKLKDPFLDKIQLDKWHWSIFSLEHPSTKVQREALFGKSHTAEKVKTPATSKPKKKHNKKLKKSMSSSVHKSVPRHVKDLIIANSFSASNPSGSLSDYTVAFNVLADNTGVLRIINFEPDNTTTFMLFVQNAITNHQQKLNGTRLLIDLRANGGGDICLGYAIIRLLFPQILNPSAGFDAADAPFGRYDTVVSPLLQALADLGMASQIANPSQCSPNQCQNNCGFLTPCTWVNPNSGLPYTDETWFNSGRTLSRGGVSKPYTNLFHGNCDGYYQQLQPSGLNRGYSPEDVAIISDGLCGSTCSVFSSYIHYNKLAKSVVLGGVKTSALKNPFPSAPTVNQQFWSFPGGQVSEIAQVQDMVLSYGMALNDSRVPQLYPNFARQTFTLREIYPWDDTVGVYPLEFMAVPAMFQFPYAVDYTNDAAIYAWLLTSDNSILGADMCATGITDLSCSMTNGTGAYSCVDGKRGTTCEAVTCIAGNTISNGVCTPCAAGTYRSADGSNQCIPCVELIGLPDSTCDVTFTTAGWGEESCPALITCPLGPNPQPCPQPGPGDDNSGIKRGVFIGVLVSLLVVILAQTFFIFRLRSQLQRATMSSDFSPLEARLM